MADPECWGQVIPGIFVLINQEFPQIHDGFKKAAATRLLELGELLRSLRSSGKLAWLGWKSQLCLLTAAQLNKRTAEMRSFRAQRPPGIQKVPSGSSVTSPRMRVTHTAQVSAPPIPGRVGWGFLAGKRVRSHFLLDGETPTEPSGETGPGALDPSMESMEPGMPRVWCPEVSPTPNPHWEGPSRAGCVTQWPDKSSAPL